MPSFCGRQWQAWRGLKRVVSIDQFAAEEAAHLDAVNLFKGGIEMAHVVAHLEQIVDVDDVFLAHLHKTVVESKQGFFVDVAL